MEYTTVISINNIKDANAAKNNSIAKTTTTMYIKKNIKKDSIISSSTSSPSPFKTVANIIFTKKIKRFDYTKPPYCFLKKCHKNIYLGQIPKTT